MVILSVIALGGLAGVAGAASARRIVRGRRRVSDESGRAPKEPEKGARWEAAFLDLMDVLTAREKAEGQMWQATFQELLPHLRAADLETREELMVRLAELERSQKELQEQIAYLIDRLEPPRF